MQSSTLLTLRSALMLACMVVVPVVAVCGTNWTKYIGFGDTPSHSTTPLAPKKVAAGAHPYARIAQTGTTGHPAESASLSGPAAAPLWLANSGPTAVPANPTMTASFETPVVGFAPAPVQPAVPQAASAAADNRVAATAFVAASTPAASDPRRLVALPPITSGEAPNRSGQQPATSTATDWFTWTQQRLRTLGATYYLLETWGRQGELYRFHCKMAIAGNPDYTRQFEATDSDAAKAMQSVLRQVEAWRAGNER